MIKQCLLVSDDGFVMTVDGRFNLSAAKTAMRKGLPAYCPDLTLRKVVGVTERRFRGKSPIDLLFGPVAWTAVPVLGEPMGTFTLDELKAKTREDFMRDRARHGGFKKKDYSAAFEQAITYDDVYALFRKPVEHLEARGIKSLY